MKKKIVISCTILLILTFIFTLSKAIPSGNQTEIPSFDSTDNSMIEGNTYSISNNTNTIQNNTNNMVNTSNSTVLNNTSNTSNNITRNNINSNSISNNTTRNSTNVSSTTNKTNTRSTNSKSANSNSAKKKSDEDDDESPMILSIILRSLLFGVIGSTIICLLIWLRHRPVKVAKNANEYVDRNTIDITNAYDHYLRSTVDKVPINKNN